MASPVATVAFIDGQAWAKAPDGSLRVLSLGDTLNADEVLITAEGARVELDFGDGQIVAIAGGQDVGMGPDLWEVTVTDPSDAALVDASVQEALTILEEGGDLSAELEETAAGDSSSGDGGGNSFVQLGRESVAPGLDQQYDFGEVSFTNSTGTLIGETVINRAPTAENLSLSLDEDSQISGRVIASDLENDPLTYVITTQPTNGIVTLNSATGEFSYQPNANYFGADSFVVTVSDPRGGSVTSTVTLDVVSVNDMPVTSDLDLTTNEDTPVDGQIIATDVENDTLTYAVTTAATNGVVTLDVATGEFTYTPNANYNGSDTFVVTVSDGNGGTTTSTVNIGITPMNDAPVTSNLNLTTDEDAPVDGQIIATDVESDMLTYSVTTAAANGVVTLDFATGEFTYTPNANYNGSDTFVVTVSDGNGGTTTSTVNIGITPMNDAPVTSNLNLTTDEDAPVDGQIIATDVENDMLTYAVTTAATNGVVTLDVATGEFTYTPNANYNGSDTFVVTVSDGNGGTTTSTVNIGITPMNDAPVTSNLNLLTNEDIPVDGQIIATDVENDTLSYSVTTAAANGTILLDPATGEFTYTPNANYNGSDTFVVTVSDGNGGTTTSTVTIGIAPVNNAPVTSNLNLATSEDIPVDGQIIATDVENDTLSYAVTTAAANGVVVINVATGEFTYTPNANYNGSDSFVVTVSDGNGGTTTSAVTIGVAPVNDAPTASNQNLVATEDSPLFGRIEAEDVDGDALTYQVATLPAHGFLVLSQADGGFVYVPGRNYNGGDSFVITVSDGKGGTTTSTINVDVTPVADAPTLTVGADTETGVIAVPPVPQGLGLTQARYTALEGEGMDPSDSYDGVSTTDLAAAVANATPVSVEVIDAVSLPSIATDDAYHFTGFIYLEAGQAYQLMGSRDDTLLVKIGGETVYASGNNQWGPINDEVTEGNRDGAAEPFTAPTNGYYSLSILVYNADYGGNLNLGLSVDGGPMLELNSDNFNLYADAAAIVGSGGADDFVPNADGGHYPEGGTEGYTYFNLNISAALTVASEILSVEVADIPVGAVLTDGTNVFTAASGSTLIDVSGWDFANVKLIPETGYSGSFALTVTATSTDGASTAETSQVVNLNVAANDTNNIVGSGLITGSDAADMLIGLNSNDQLIGGAESDVLIGGQGNDILTGGLGADTFKWTLGDAGEAGAPAQDVITDFNTAQNDVLDLSDLLQGEDATSLTDYLHITSDGTNTIVNISSQGGYSGGVYNAAATDQTITLDGFAASGTDSADMINQLKAGGNLLTD